jgi:hypothetical protein
MKNLIRILLCLCLIDFAISRAISFAALPSPSLADTAKTAPKKPSGKKATAKELIASAKKALAAMVKNARADKELDPKNPKNKPFYAAVKKISKQLNRAEKGLTAKSNDFFDAIRQTRAAEEQMKVDWELADSKNKGVIGNGKKLGHALAILRTDYSKEALRKQKGGELTAKEKAEFAKIKAQQKDLIAKIDKLKAKAKKDKALEYGLKEMEKEARRVVKAPLTVDAFIATLYLIDEIRGQLYGYDYYVDKDWRSDWIVVDTYVTSWDATYAEFETSETYEWASIDIAVDIDVGEEVDVSESVSADEITAEENYVENESFDMSEAEENEVAEEEDSDADVDSDESADDDSMDDASDDEGEDMSDDEGGGDEDTGDEGGDDGGDDGGE